MARPRGHNRVISYDVETGVVVLDVSTRKFPGAVSAMDYVDWRYLVDELGGGRISLNKKGYPVSAINRRVIQVHILLNPAWEQTDHVNRVRHDNTRANLREATPLENARNRSIPENNTSGVLGVSWDVNRAKWVARIQGKQLGRFKDFDNAVACRLEAESREYGSFAPERGSENTASDPMDRNGQKP